MKKLIEFHLIHEFPNQDYIIPPVPSKKLLPDWLKKMPTHNRNNEDVIDPTLKKCVPVIDAMTSGYTILTHMDIVLNLTEDIYDYICDKIDISKINVLYNICKSICTYYCY